jgi:hypothetical protein
VGFVIILHIRVPPKITIIGNCMSKRKLSVSEIAHVIESEGLGYAIQSYLSSSQIKDDDLADMWERASDLLKEITEYVEDNSDDVNDSDDTDEAPEENEY